MSEIPIAVKSATGIWTAAGVWTLAGGFFSSAALIAVAYIRQWGPWKKIDNEREANLLAERAKEMEGMRGRLEKLESRVADQAKRHDSHNKIVSQLHEAEIALLRHRLNGEEQVNIALMSVLQTLDVPQRVLDALEETRIRKQEAVANEQSALTMLRAVAVEKIAQLTEPAE